MSKPLIMAPGVFSIACVMFGHKFVNIANWFFCERCCKQVGIGGMQ